MRKAIIVGAILTVVLVCIISASTILFLQGSSYGKVTVVEGQISSVKFDDKSYTFAKDGKSLYVFAFAAELSETGIYIPVKGSIYHYMGIEIIVDEVEADWFVLLVKPEWG